MGVPLKLLLALISLEKQLKDQFWQIFGGKLESLGENLPLHPPVDRTLIVDSMVLS